MSQEVSQKELERIEEELYQCTEETILKRRVLPRDRPPEDEAFENLSGYVSRGYFKKTVSSKGVEQYQWTTEGLKVYVFLRTLKWFIGMNADPFGYLENEYKTGRRFTKKLIQIPPFLKKYREELENLMTGKRSVVDLF